MLWAGLELTDGSVGVGSPDVLIEVGWGLGAPGPLPLKLAENLEFILLLGKLLFVLGYMLMVVFGLGLLLLLLT